MLLVLCSSSSVVSPSCRRWAHLVENNMHVLFNPTWRIDLLTSWGVSVESDVSLLHVPREFTHAGGVSEAGTPVGFEWRLGLDEAASHWSLTAFMSRPVPPRLSVWPALLSLMLHLPSFSLNWPSPYLCFHPHLHTLSLSASLLPPSPSLSCLWVITLVSRPCKQCGGINQTSLFHSRFFSRWHRSCSLSSAGLYPHLKDHSCLFSFGYNS